jgi:allantoin racemase
MTATMVETARAVAGPGVQIDPLTAPRGPAAIESHVDEAYAAVSVVELVRDHPGYDAYIVACASDPGLFAARELVEAPVVGIGEAAYLLASTLGRRFVVITTLARDIAPAGERVEALGLGALCAGVVAAEVGVLDTGVQNELGVERMIAAGRGALDRWDADVIVLGCGGMTDTARAVSVALDVPVVDGVVAAMVLAEGLVRCGLHTSKRASFAPPEPIAYLGVAAPSSVGRVGSRS